MIELARVIDNPVALRAAFGRLRFPGAWIGIAVLGIICAFIAGASFLLAATQRLGLDRLRENMTVSFGLIFGLQCLILFMGGTGAIATAVAADRERGVFDMMKIVPRPSWHIMGGYILGMPLREHIWVLVMMPFAWLAALFSEVSPLGAAVLYAVFYAAAVLYHVFGALAGVVVRQPRAAASTSVGVVMLCATLVALFFPHLSIWATAIWVFSRGREMAFSQVFNWGVPVALYSLATMSLLGVFLWLAAVRKFRHEERPSLSKPQSLLFGALFQLLLFGGLYAYLHGTSWTGSILSRSPDAAHFAYFLISYFLALALVSMGTPGAGLYARSARRAGRTGRRSIGFLRDAGLNGPHALLVTLLFAATVPLLPGGADRRIMIALIYISSLLLFGGLLQACRLRISRNWLPVFLGLMFLLWGLPIGLAIVCAVADAPSGVVAIAGGLFPGIGLASAHEGDGLAGLAVIAGVNLILAAAASAYSRSAGRRFWERQDAPSLQPAAGR